MLVEIGGSLTWEGEMPQLDRPNPSLWRLLDERSHAGGRIKAWLFLTHPGPSLLVTALVVAAAGLLTRQLPTARTAIGLTLMMLPTQLATGALNDWADVELDRAAKPYKPIPRGMVARRGALGFAVAGFTVSLGAAAWFSPQVFGVDALAVLAGASYDLVLKRTPAALLAYSAGFVAVPLLAMVTTGTLRGGADIVPLAGLVALALEIANGLPDIEGDRRGGSNTLPVALGVNRSRWVMGLALAVAAVYVIADRGRLGQSSLVLLGAALLGAGALVPLLLRGAATHRVPAAGRARSRRDRQLAGGAAPSNARLKTARSSSLKRAKVICSAGSRRGQRPHRLLDGDGRGGLDGEPVDPRAERRACHRRAAVLGSEREGAAVGRAQLVGLAAAAVTPPWANGVDDVPRAQPAGAGDDRAPVGQPS